ncbi:unnamed protein product, partial [Polarella glacialis]
NATNMSASDEEETDSSGSSLAFGEALPQELSGLRLTATLGGTGTTPTFQVPDAIQRTKNPGTWLICYCVQALSDPTHSCETAEGFSSQVGFLTVPGPLPHQDMSCTLGMPCK